MKILLIFVFMGCLLGCTQPANNPEADLADLQKQLAGIVDYINSGTCAGESNCSYIAVGSKPCGGPRGYLAFSTNLDLVVLENMADAYTRAEKAYNERTGATSDCSLAPVPRQLACEDGKCVVIE